jgi:hypothetical protein
LTDALKRLFVELEDKLCKPRKTTCFESINWVFLKQIELEQKSKLSKWTCSQFGYGPYFKDKDGEALPGKKQSAILLFIIL